MVDTGIYMERHAPRPTRFVWQIVLIAAPVLILSGISLYSLRQDRAAVEQEARDSARTMLPNLSDQWRDSVRRDVEAFLDDYYLAEYVPVALAWPEASGIFKAEDAAAVRPRVERARADPLLDSVPQARCAVSDGRATAPVEYPPLPVPPDWVKELSPAQAGLLQELEQELYRGRNPAAAARVRAKMRIARVPESALAAADLETLMLEATQTPATLQSAKLVDFARKYPDSTTASGTPAADLALIRALRSAPRGASEGALRDEVFRRVTRHPSFLTPEIIAAAEPLGPDTVQSLETIWNAQEEARAFLRLAQKIPPDPTHRETRAWLQHDGRMVLATRETAVFGRNYSFTLMPGPVLERAFLKALDATRARIPAYMSPEVEIAGRSWSAAPGRLEPAVGEVLQLLASYSGGLAVQHNIPDAALQIRDRSLAQLWPPDSFSTVFTISLRLTRPDLLYSAHRHRLWYTAGLILAAAAAAGIGLVNAWKGFRRQVQLAEMTSNFVSSVSHELRAPLASVRLMAESLDRGRVGDRQKRQDYFRLIVQECRRLTSLVDNVLDFSRIRQGRRQYEFEPVDGAALIRQTVRTMEPVAAERGVALACCEPAGPVPDWQPVWDASAVQQAIVNLLDNAIKHSPSGSAVGVGFEVTGDARVRITVEDQGPGIPAGERERIFDPFYRLGSELRRETRGIGIGLSIVKHVAEAHGGRVFVESAPGGGSRFTLELASKPQS